MSPSPPHIKVVMESFVNEQLYSSAAAQQSNTKKNLPLAGDMNKMNATRITKILPVYTARNVITGSQEIHVLIG